MAAKLMKRFVPAAAAVVLVLGAAGCGGDEGGDAAGSTAFAEALAEASWSGEGSLYVTWVDVAALREAGDLPADTEDAFDGGRWGTPVAIAVGDALTGVIGVDTGFDPMATDETLSVGNPPDNATRYAGVDAEAVESAFAELGFEAEGEFLALGDEGGVVVGDSGADLFGVNRVATEGDVVAIGAFEEPVAAALGGEEPVIDEPGMSAAADCLGSDAFAASVVDPEGGASEEVALAGVALRSPGDDGSVPEVVCAVGSEGGSIEEVAECMRGAFGPDGVNPVTARPFSFDLGEAEVDEGESDGVPWARAVFEPASDAPAGTVFEMLSDGSLELALGGVDPAQLGGDRLTPEQAEEIADQLDGCGG